jgi:putative chitinase
VLRYPTQEEVIIVQVNMRQIQKGDICVEVGMLQTLLNKLGYKGSNGRALTVDNDFGANCDYAVKNFQKSKGLNPDGIVGAKTWDFLVKSNYV